MLKFLLVALFFAFALGQNTTTPNCDNILFRERLGEFWDDILYLQTPAPYDGNSPTCHFHFQPGDLQCCSDAVYDIIRNVWIRARIQINIAVAVAKTIRQSWINARERFRPVRNDVDNALTRGEITQQTHDALINFINRVLAAWDNFINRLIDDWVNCMTLVLKYWAGIICLGCDPSWERYIYENGQGQLRLRLTVDTCNQIRSGCLPVWQLTFEFITDLQTALNQLRIDLGAQPVDYGNETLCGGDCGAWLCDVFFGGRNAQTDTLPQPGDARKRNADSIKTVFMHFESQVIQSYHPHPNGPAFVESFSDLLWSTHKAFHAIEQAQRQTTGATNEYVADGGYNPVEVGENSQLDTRVSGAASALTTWIHDLFQYL